MRTCAIILIFFSFLLNVNAQIINPLGSGLTMRGSVYDIVLDAHSDRSYFVGNFSAIDGIKMDKVALKENEEWKAIPDTSEITGVVYCAEVHEGDLYIGGNFTISSSTKITNLAKLVNGTWKPLGIEPMSGSIRDITWFEGELYVTGDFRSIRGIKNNGIMKYSNAQWQDSGLDSYLNAEGLFVSGDTLFAWGNGFSTDGGDSHIASFYTDEEWTTLPNIGFDPSVSSGCIMYNGNLYVTRYNKLQRFNFKTYEWEVVASLLFSPESAMLFEHVGDLYAVFDEYNFYRLSNGNWELVELVENQGANDYIFGSINIVKTVDGKMIIGGDFQHWDSKSVSLSIFDNMNFSAYGKVSSRITRKSAWEYSIGSSIVTYNDKYVIAGKFSFADDIYSPNIVYWDGEEFSPFDFPLTKSIRQLEVFESELYAVIIADDENDPTLLGYSMLKFDGDEWVGIETPFVVEEINIVNNKMFILIDYSMNSTDGGPFYLQDNNWQELKPFPISGTIPWYRYGNVRSYNDGYLMPIYHYPVGDQLIYLPNDTSDWVVLDTIDIYFDHLHTIEEKKFLVNDWPRIIYEIRDDKIEIIAEDIEVENPFFFTLEDEIYFSAWNGFLSRYNDQNTFDFYNELRIRDLEMISDNQYLVTMQSSGYSTGLERIELNNLGILTFEPLKVDLEKDRQNICPKNHIQYWPSTDHVNVSYQWDFEGGVPVTSNVAHPMVKYNLPGTYTSTLRATNIDNDTVYLTSEIHVDDCVIPESRANNHDNIWIMGYNFNNGGLGGFDFTFPDSVISARYSSPKELHNGTVVMSDVQGNLQFYSNGISIMNRNNQPIQGSDCFNSGLNYSLDRFISNQSLLSIPVVDNDSVYHLFDLDPLQIDGEYWSSASNLSITTIDMTRNDGHGEVVNCNEEIINDILLHSTMQATRHNNGEDWWIIVGKYQSDEYYKILLTKNGVESVETSYWNRYYESAFNGQSTFSPNGQFYAQVIRENQEVSIWKFDNQTGELSERQVYTIVPVDESEYPQGCSFSPDSRFLYVSSRTQLRQIDLCNYDEIEVELIDSWDGTFEFIYPLYFGKQMLAPNQKIIVTPVGNSHRSFGVIESPNEKGTNCNFKQHSLKLSELNRNSADVIPIFPHFRNYPSYEGDCEIVSTTPTNISDSFYVYPNPIRSNIALHFSQKATGDLYDVEGKKIYSFYNIDYLDINSLRAGVYIIKTDVGTQRFVKF